MIHTETEMHMIATKYYVTNVNAYKKGTLLEKNVPFYNIKYILHIAETLTPKELWTRINRFVVCASISHLTTKFTVHKTQCTKITQ